MVSPELENGENKPQRVSSGQTGLLDSIGQLTDSE